MNYGSTQFAEKHAEDDFLKYQMKIRSGESPKFPLEPDHVAEMLWDTLVVFVKKGTLPEGSIASADLESNTIRVESSGYEPRDRFSTAHEVGHISIHRIILELPNMRRNAQIFREYQANAYAGSLLMPSVFVRKCIQNETGIIDSNEEKIKIVAERFGVSKRAAKVRLENLGLIESKRIFKAVDLYERESQLMRDKWFEDR